MIKCILLLGHIINPLIMYLLDVGIKVSFPTNFCCLLKELCHDNMGRTLLKSTAKHDEGGHHTCGSSQYTTPIAVDRSSPMHLMLAAKPENEG